MTFDELIVFLEANGYRLMADPKYPSPRIVRFARINEGCSKRVMLGFCEPNDGKSYEQLNGKIAADHRDCFDKWQKCPLVLPFPKNEIQAKELLKMLEHLGSDEGYQLSNNFDYLDNNPYKYSEGE